jgi:hypothetical protein
MEHWQKVIITREGNTKKKIKIRPDKNDVESLVEVRRKKSLDKIDNDKRYLCSNKKSSDKNGSCIMVNNKKEDNHDIIRKQDREKMKLSMSAMEKIGW